MVTPEGIPALPKIPHKTVIDLKNKMETKKLRLYKHLCQTLGTRYTPKELAAIIGCSTGYVLSCFHRLQRTNRYYGKTILDTDGKRYWLTESLEPYLKKPKPIEFQWVTLEQIRGESVVRIGPGYFPIEIARLIRRQLLRVLKGI